ncbi:MAG: peptidylprolyl isomerase [Alphaproteobacteria bacterium]|nr:peptidylprolyl isomerase [Alphaproteobacteria bacterium]
MPDIQVNGVEVPEAAIRAEAQNHPAESPDEAFGAAAQALVIRELLLQQARALKLAPQPQTDDSGRRETEEDALIRRLLESEISLPEADDDTCRRYFDNNRERFRSPDLYEAAHILFAADPADTDGYASATAAAEATLETLDRDPGAFAAIARERSDCTSASNGGRLGQVARGDTVAEFETFLVNLEEGQLCPVPVKSRYGVHVLRLDKRIEGRPLPFEAVRDRIAGYLHEASWRRGVAQYIRLLAGNARIDGIDLNGATSPLVQ